MAKVAAAKQKAIRKNTASRSNTSVQSADLPYLVTTKRLGDLFNGIRSAAVPPRLTFEFLQKLGFKSSNDRALPSLLKKIGFIDAGGVPTERYKRYRDPSHAGHELANGIREAYAELFSANQSAHSLPREQLKGAIAHVSGADAKYAALIASTFVTLCALADFTLETTQGTGVDVGPVEVERSEEIPVVGRAAVKAGVGMDFRYNIEIHLPATTDVSVYNAIFKSLREHLL